MDECSTEEEPLSVKSPRAGQTVSPVNVLPSCGQRQNIFVVTFQSALLSDNRNQVYFQVIFHIFWCITVNIVKNKQTNKNN